MSFNFVGLKKLFTNKAVQWGIGIVTLILVLFQLYDSVYDRGWRDAEIEIQAEHNKILVERKKEYEKRTQEALDILATDMQAEIDRIKHEQTVKEEAKYVIEFIGEEIKVPAECRDITDTIVRVLHKIKSIGSGGLQRD